MGGASTKRVKDLEAKTDALEKKVQDQDAEVQRHAGLISDIQLRHAAQDIDAQPPTPVTSAQVKDILSEYTLKTESTDIMDKIRIHKAKTEPLLEALHEKATAVHDQIQDLEAQIPANRMKELESEVERLVKAMHVADERAFGQKVELHNLTAELEATKEDLKCQQAALQNADEIRKQETERLEEDRRRLTLKLEDTLLQGQQHKEALEAENSQLLAEFELVKEINEQTMNDLETQKECLKRELDDTRARATAKLQTMQARNNEVERQRKCTHEALGLLQEVESRQRVEELQRTRPSADTMQRQNLLLPEIDL